MRRLGLLLACLAALLGTAWYAGSRFDTPAPGPAPGTVRLGPETGERVADYLARLPGELPAPGVEVLALAQLTAEVTPQEAAALVGGPPPTGGPSAVAVVLHVPMPRVQTALRFAEVDLGRPPPAALDGAREHARFTAAADAARREGRAAEVARAEATALTDPACRCVLALVVRADRAGLDALAARPGVRAVESAPPGSAPVELALAPLLPGQTERADPLPDDGPVPQAAS